MSCREIVALLSGIIGLGAIIGATVSNEWKSTSRASSVITATWVFQGLWMNCAAEAMGNMATEITAFVVATAGWVLVSSTLPTDYWKVSSIDGTVITTATYWSNLWKTCVTDSTGVSNCKDFPSMLALDGYIQVCRGLMISAVCLGFFATACALLGMKCTKVGGNDRIKARIACCAGLQFFASGLCSLSACSLYAHRITSEFFDPMFMAQKYELGAALFIGWAGSALCILGGIVFFLSLSDGFNKSQTNTNGRRYVYHTTSYASSPGKSKNSTANGRKPPKDYSSTSLQFDKNAYV
ncbi:claudin-10-like isoform X1 [Trichomycterus rosablanca]|uniref:claudin-10-like isoform X1 n=1 Tax=Trichomycterus rosablanca TaxID=2290929 RepID=UPI002F35A13B